MPFVDLSSPVAPKPITPLVPVQSQPVSGSTPVTSNPIPNNLAQGVNLASAQPVNSSPSTQVKDNEEHTLMQNVPSSIKNPVSGVVERKGPPINPIASTLQNKVVDTLQTQSLTQEPRSTIVPEMPSFMKNKNVAPAAAPINNAAPLGVLPKKEDKPPVKQVPPVRLDPKPVGVTSQAAEPTLTNTTKLPPLDTILGINQTQSSKSTTGVLGTLPVTSQVPPAAKPQDAIEKKVEEQKQPQSVKVTTPIVEAPKQDVPKVTKTIPNPLEAPVLKPHAENADLNRVQVSTPTTVSEVKKEEVKPVTPIKPLESNDTLPSVQGLKDIAPTPGDLKSSYTKQIDTLHFKPSESSMNDFMAYVVASKGSDLHISSEYPAFVRIDGRLREIVGEILTNERVESLLKQIFTDDEMAKLKSDKEIDLSYTHPLGDRFRINAFYKAGKLSCACRFIPQRIRTIAELNLSNILYEFTKLPHGLILVTGPTGSGKSTTLAAMIQEVNISRSEHIITIEDPVEYVYPRRKSLIEQREIGKDTKGWHNALRSALRQDPNIVLVGEMRDYETIESTLTIAETGHLVFASLHTNSAAQTIDRIIDVFPEGQQSQIRTQLSSTLAAVISQRLVPIKSGGRRAVQEILIANNAVKNAIREGKTYLIDNIIQTNSEMGMQTLEAGLVKLIREGQLSIEEAQNYTIKYEQLLSLLKTN